MRLSLRSALPLLLVLSITGLSRAQSSDPGAPGAEEAGAPGAEEAGAPGAVQEVVDDTALRPSEREILTLALQAELISESLSEVVGTAISPLVGMGAIGVVGYIRAPAEARAALPWYNQPWFWISVISLLVLVALKDTIGSTVPFVKKPLDALELVENQVSALVAAPIVLNQTLRQLRPVADTLLGSLASYLDPVAYAATGVPAVSSSPGALEAVSLTITALFMAAIYVVVWTSGHVVNVLVFLNPISFIDWAMKSGRLAVIGLVVGATAINPWFGIIVSALVIAVAFKLFGWSLRLTTLGTVTAWDIITRKSMPVATEDGRLMAFSADCMPAVATRTLGRLVRAADGSLTFHYRPFLVLPMRIASVPAATGRLEIGQGLVSPLAIDSYATAGDDGYRVLFRFAPRYRQQERALADAIGAADVRDVSIARSVGAAWRWVKSQVRSGCEPAPADTASA